MKRKRKPYVPPIQGDTGPDTPAQRTGAVLVKETENGVTTQYLRRDHMVTQMLKGGHLTARQAAAGIELADRWDDTMRSPDPSWTRIFVDSSPKPGDVNVAQLEAKARWQELSAHIPREARGVTVCVCCYNLAIRPHFTSNTRMVPILRHRLQNALDRVADHMNWR